MLNELTDHQLKIALKHKKMRQIILSNSWGFFFAVFNQIDTVKGRESGFLGKETNYPILTTN